MARKDQSPAPSGIRGAWKLLSATAGLGLGAFLSLACSPAEDTTPSYEGSCPILIECAPELVPNTDADELTRDLDTAYGPEGTCWASGRIYHEQCRNSCVAALEQYNLAVVGQGASCGTCTTDSECAPFGNDAICIENFCARRELGDVASDSGADTDPSTGDVADSGEDTGETGVLDPACAVGAPRVIFETNLGTISVDIDVEAEPAASALFLQNVSDKFYDNMLFHQVVDGVSMQAGAFRPGLVLATPPDEISYASTPALDHDALSIALISIEGVLSGQFYLTDSPGPSPEAPGLGVVIGRIIGGAEVRDQISAVEVSTVTWMDFVLQSMPNDDVIIELAYCEE